LSRSVLSFSLKDKPAHAAFKLKRIPYHLVSCRSLTPQVIGSLASKPPQDKDPLSGLLVSKDFSYTLLDPKDLKDFTGLGTSEITQRQRVRIGVGWDVVKWHLEGMYGEVEEDVVDNRPVFVVS
jgi:hypothetical protein